MKIINYRARKSNTLNNPLLKIESKDIPTINEEIASSVAGKEIRERAFQLEQERKEKISLSFISYRVKRNKYKFFHKLKSNEYIVHKSSSSESEIIKPIKTNILLTEISQPKKLENSSSSRFNKLYSNKTSAIKSFFSNSIIKQYFILFYFYFFKELRSIYKKKNNQNH